MKLSSVKLFPKVSCFESESPRHFYWEQHNVFTVPGFSKPVFDKKMIHTSTVKIAMYLFFSYSGSYQKLYMIIIWLTLWCKFALKWQVRLINYVKRWLISNYFLIGADCQHNMVIGLKNCAERFLNPI